MNHDNVRIFSCIIDAKSWLSCSALVWFNSILHIYLVFLSKILSIYVIRNRNSKGIFTLLLISKFMSKDVLNHFPNPLIFYVNRWLQLKTSYDLLKKRTSMMSTLCMSLWTLIFIRLCSPTKRWLMTIVGFGLSFRCLLCIINSRFCIKLQLGCRFSVFTIILIFIQKFAVLPIPNSARTEICAFCKCPAPWSETEQFAPQC